MTEEVLIESFSPFIKKYAHCLRGHNPLLQHDDLCQLGYLALILGFRSKSYTHAENKQSYLGMCAKNGMLDGFRKAKMGKGTKKKVEFVELIDNMVSCGFKDIEDKAQVSKLMEGIKPSDREFISTFYYDGLTLKEAANVQGRKSKVHTWRNITRIVGRIRKRAKIEV